MPFDNFNGNSTEDRRVVITGMGVVSTAGSTVSDLWSSLTSQTAGKVSDQWLQHGPSASGRARFCGRIDDFPNLSDPMRAMLRKSLRLMNRETQLGVAAGQQALCMSGVATQVEPERIGVCFAADNFAVTPEDFAAGVRACVDASGTLALEQWGAVGLNEIAPLWMLKCLPNMPACHLAIFNDLRGPVNTITQRDVGANQAVAEAYRCIRRGEVDAMLVGATSETLSPMNQLHARLECERAQDEQHSVEQPVDCHLQGPAPGEGAGALVLESLELAKRRSARIYGEVVGCASSASFGSSVVRGCRNAAATALRLALKRASLSPSQVGHVHAHALGAISSDLAEAEALKDVFGSLIQQIPIVSTKGQLTNTGTASGLIELIVSVLALEDGHLFEARTSTDLESCSSLHLATRQDRAGESCLNLNVFGRGLASCVAVARIDRSRTLMAGGAA